MKLSITVVLEDGSAVDATASTADLLKWEERTDRSLATLFEKRRLTDFAWLAWHSLSRREVTSLDYDSWLLTIDTLKIGRDDEEMVPLDQPASTGRS